jgi:nucleoside 2-deoxyribosyltransferase
VQVDLPTEEPLVVMLAGPIKIWWTPGQWDSPAHREFVQWRDAVRVACVKAGFLVYSPHRAWQGAWSESAQRVNDMAIEMADVVLDLTPPDTEADGTLAEVAYADKVGTPVRPLPPGDAQTLATALAELGTLPR